jgi:hypothetical protein
MFALGAQAWSSAVCGLFSDGMKTGFLFGGGKPGAAGKLKANFFRPAFRKILIVKLKGGDKLQKINNS